MILILIFPMSLSLLLPLMEDTRVLITDLPEELADPIEAVVIIQYITIQ
jgi:hypothetical protein